MLANVSSVPAHGPDVHGPVPVGDEVDPVLPDHGGVTLAVVVPGEFHRVVGSLRELPHVPGRAAGVALGDIVVEGGADEIEGPAGFVVGPFRGGIEGDSVPPVLLQVQGHELILGQGGEVGRGIYEAAIWGPCGGDGRFSFVRASHRHASTQGHGVDFRGSLVLGREGQSGPVRGNPGVSLLPRMGGEALGHASCHLHSPQVALCGEDGDVSMKVREPIEPKAFLGLSLGGGRREYQGEDEEESDEPGHGVPPEYGLRGTGLMF